MKPQPKHVSSKTLWTVRDTFKTGSSRIGAFTHRNYRIGLHNHEFIEINLISQGRGQHFMEDHSMEVRRGDAFVVPSLVKHGYIDAGGLDVCHILLHPDYITENLNRFRWLDGYLAFFTMEPYFRRHGKFRHGLKLEESDCANAISLFQKIEQEGQVRKSGSNWMQECLVSQLIIMLCRIHAAAFIQQLEPSGTHVHLRAVLNAITLAAKKKTVDVSLNEMAHAAGLERSYFCRVFKKITGMTPREFVRYEVTREARRLLFESSLNISEIALKLGYCDSAHFCSSFRTITGYNPSELRRRYFDFESVRKI